MTALHGHGEQQALDGTCPGPPTQSQTAGDHLCSGDCGCPCHAPLLSALIFLTHSRSFTYLKYAEPIWHISEVYLSLFVPPDSSKA
jgi:hypothetical protein